MPIKSGQNLKAGAESAVLKQHSLTLVNCARLLSAPPVGSDRSFGVGFVKWGTPFCVNLKLDFLSSQAAILRRHKDVRELGGCICVSFIRLTYT